MKQLYIKNVSTLKLNVSKCSGCMMCMYVCPHAVFVIKDKKSFITNKNKCMECGACVNNCPEEALSVRSGVGCAAGVINGIFNKTEASCGC